jgi:hypothetical protein
MSCGNLFIFSTTLLANEKRDQICTALFHSPVVMALIGRGTFTAGIMLPVLPDAKIAPLRERINDASAALMLSVMARLVHTRLRALLEAVTLHPVVPVKVRPAKGKVGASMKSDSTNA